ncbi:MAG TPA: response regulator transcription factor [Anaerolineales bacterium]|nr:response regulator transcription factor [Anaerolineales bacterium]
MRILFADDDADTRKVVGGILHKAGLNPVFAENGSRALKLWQDNSFDLIILDYMMPVMDGVETCRRIRRVSDVPIILLTARGSEQDALAGFKAGADDYIVKPFRAAELVARIHAILNRTMRQRMYLENPLAFANLVLDSDARQVTFRGENIQLSPLEFRLLQYLMVHAGTTVSKQDLLYDVWGFCDLAGEINLIEAAIKRLRKKIEPDPSKPKYIRTVWGTGYRFEY